MLSEPNMHCTCKETRSQVLSMQAKLSQDIYLDVMVERIHLINFGPFSFFLRTRIKMIVHAIATKVMGMSKMPPTAGQMEPKMVKATKNSLVRASGKREMTGKQQLT